MCAVSRSILAPGPTARSYGQGVRPVPESARAGDPRSHGGRIGIRAVPPYILRERQARLSPGRSRSGHDTSWRGPLADTTATAEPTRRDFLYIATGAAGVVGTAALA